jgi:26S proteasome regulatory subunit N9
MRAMSLSLVKGSIDQVEQSVDVTWVQPRILDKTQLGVISDQLGNWADRVKDTLVTVEDQTAELYC